MSRGMCGKYVGVHWADDELRIQGAQMGLRDHWWVFGVCGYKHGHIGRCLGDDPEPRWRRVKYAVQRVLLPYWLTSRAHLLMCRLGRHHRLHLSDGSDPCIYCERDWWMEP